MAKATKFRDKLVSRTPAFAMRGYIDDVIKDVVSMDPFRVSDLIMKEVEGRRWGARVSVQEAFNQASLRVLVDLVGRDFNLYDRVVSSLRAPHDKQLAGMKLLALGDPKYRVAKTIKYFKRRPWASSMSIQAAIEDKLGDFSWFESVRMDQTKINEFGGTLNVTGGLVRFTIRSLTTKKGNHVIRLALDRTAMEGDIAVLQDYVTEAEVFGLVSGSRFDRGDNADAEVMAVKTAWDKVTKEDQEIFIVELYSSPEDGEVSPLEFADNMMPFVAAVKTALSVPDFAPAPDGAADDFFAVFIEKNPEAEKKKAVTEEDLDEFLNKYQRGMHDLGLNDVSRKFMDAGFRVAPRKVKRVDMESPMRDVSPMRWMEGSKKKDLQEEVRRSINGFAESFYVHMTKVQSTFGGTAFSYRSPSDGKAIFDTRPSACWVRAGKDKTRWHFGFQADRKNVVEAALKRSQGWLKRKAGNRTKVVRSAIVKADKGYAGSSVVEIPISAIAADKGFSNYPQGQSMWFEGDPDSGIEGQEVLMMSEWPEETGQVAKVRIPESGKEQVVPRSLLRDLSQDIIGSLHADMAERVAIRSVTAKPRGKVTLERSEQADWHYAFYVNGEKLLTTNAGWLEQNDGKWSLAFMGRYAAPQPVSEEKWRVRAKWLGIPPDVIDSYIQGRGDSFVDREIDELNERLNFTEEDD